MTSDDKVTKGILGWFALQVCQLVGFVFFALYRYAGLIVLSVDAIILSGGERTKTLNVAAAPAAIELYFFLQAWFQAAPQAVFQIHLLFRESLANRTNQSVIVQVLSIFMSIAVVAIETTSFQRFESQRVNGRKLPWAMWLKKYRIQELSNFEERTPLQSINKPEDNTTNPDENTIENKDELGVLEEQKESVEQGESHISLERQISVTPPLPPKNAHITPPPTPLRGITTVIPLPVPDVPAPPRPDSTYISPENQNQPKAPAKSVSIAEENKKIAESAESLKVPRRKYSSKGLEEDDPIGKLLSFLWSDRISLRNHVGISLLLCKIL
ncbi:hypothetical protein KM043_009214 [Ampulex compressa]|nr:hypothetical protein KM043_009214 [Ampulex compressa]